MFSLIPPVLSACDPGRLARSEGAPAAAAPAVVRAPYGRLPDGRAVHVYTLTSGRGMEVRIIEYGAIVTAIMVPDRDGRLADVVLGYDGLEPYFRNPPYFGAVIGRYANRIARSQFTLDGRTHRLTSNDRGNALHGGQRGFDEALWRAEPFTRTNEAGLELTHTSPDGDQGFPGELTVRVTVTLNPANELTFDYHAVTDAPTVVNLTHHGYFNLAGAGSGSIAEHLLMINASRFTPVDDELLPLGELAAVSGTPFDFQKAAALGERVDGTHPQLLLAGGYDHNFVLDDAAESPAFAARLEHPGSGRVLEVRTTEPGLQLYTGNYLHRVAGKQGQIYDEHAGLCLETQHFPDSPNQPSFPSTTLRPGEVYRSRTVYAFSVK